MIKLEDIINNIFKAYLQNINNISVYYMNRGVSLCLHTDGVKPNN